MKIIILTSSTDIRYGGGMDRVIHNAKEALNKEFELVLYLSGKNIYTFCSGIFKILMNNPFTFSFIIFNSLSSVRSSANPFWKMYYFFCRLFFIKLVFYWHEMPEYYSRFAVREKSAADSIERFFKNRKCIQLCCSEANKQSALFFDQAPNVTNISNCIVPRDYNKNLLFSKFTVVTVGSIQEIKGTDIWTDVAIKVCQKNDSIQFIWCGGVLMNELFANCQQKIKEANLEDRISFLGKVEDAAVITSAAHLYYCSSRLDSFPLSILEAMNHGKNIIYYNSGGVIEAVGANGIFISNFSIEKTVDAILEKHQEFIANPNTVFNKNLYDKFYENYTPEVFTKKMKKALEK